MNVGDCESRRRNRDEFYILFFLLFFTRFFFLSFYFSREGNVRSISFFDQFIHRERDNLFAKDDEYMSIAIIDRKFKQQPDILFRVIRVR